MSKKFVPKEEVEEAIADISELVREARKKDLNVDFYANELIDKPLLIKGVDLKNNILIAELDGKEVKIAFRSAVILKKAMLINEALEKFPGGIKAVIVRKTSKKNPSLTYLDLVGTNALEKAKMKQ